jgi:hypothetical protein
MWDDDKHVFVFIPKYMITNKNCTIHSFNLKELKQLILTSSKGIKSDEDLWVSYQGLE